MFFVLAFTQASPTSAKFPCLENPVLSERHKTTIFVPSRLFLISTDRNLPNQQLPVLILYKHSRQSCTIRELLPLFVIRELRVGLPL